MNSASIAPSAVTNPADNPESLTAESSDRLLTIDDIARWFGVSRAWVYDHTTRKRPLLPCIRFGEMTRFRRSDVESFIRSHAKHHDSK
ncbi:MAG: helix-turn-helix domain-containing protein [Bryobacteraceae bacterium]